MNDDLRALGDVIEAAIARDIEHERNTVTALRHVPVVHHDTAQEASVLTDNQDTTTVTPIRRRRSRRVVVIAGLATLAIGGAAAATAYRLSDDEVSKGLPGGSAIFEGTNPSCTSHDDGIVFDCTLASAPTVEVLDDYTGAAELFVDANKNIAGGCRGITADGLQWTCYVGDRAVEEDILSADLLGEYAPEPGRG